MQQGTINRELIVMWEGHTMGSMEGSKLAATPTAGISGSEEIFKGGNVAVLEMNPVLGVDSNTRDYYHLHTKIYFTI
jgi:hypothetical protein